VAHVNAGLVVLAAGEGRRYGHAAKQLHPVGGRPMLDVVLAAAAASGVEPRVVVLGAHADQVLAAIELHRAQPVICEEWAGGQAVTLAAGLAALGDVDAALVVLGDGPHLAGEAIARVLAAYDPAEPDAVLAATYGRGRSHPVLLPRRVWSRLPLSGETPARSLPARLVDCSDLPEPGDVDYAD
jgi:molybdenum cofactor cytidylyltransferase